MHHWRAGPSRPASSFPRAGPRPLRLGQHSAGLGRVRWSIAAPTPAPTEPVASWGSTLRARAWCAGRSLPQPRLPPRLPHLGAAIYVPVCPVLVSRCPKCPPGRTACGWGSNLRVRTSCAGRSLPQPRRGPRRTHLGAVIYLLACSVLVSRCPKSGAGLQVCCWGSDLPVRTASSGRSLPQLQRRSQCHVRCWGSGLQARAWCGGRSLPQLFGPRGRHVWQRAADVSRPSEGAGMSEGVNQARGHGNRAAIHARRHQRRAARTLAQ